MPVKTSTRRTRTAGERERADRLRLVRYWVPDLRDPRIRASIRREGALLAKHPENATIDAWLDAVHDASADS